MGSFTKRTCIDEMTVAGRLIDEKEQLADQDHIDAHAIGR